MLLVAVVISYGTWVCWGVCYVGYLLFGGFMVWVFVVIFKLLFGT